MADKEMYDVGAKDASNANKTKQMAALIVGKLDPSSKPIEGAKEGESENGEAMDVACQEMMTALQSNDVTAFKSALDAYLDMR